MQPPTDIMPEPTMTNEAHDEGLGGIEGLTAKTEQFAREDPMRAVGYAFLAGLFLNVLPLGALLAGALRLAMALVKPALVILGAVKVYEEVTERQTGK